MKNHLKFLLLSIFALMLSPVIAQPPPPPSGYTPNIGTLGPIAPRAITNNGSFTWSIENNTGCTATFVNWFRIKQYASEGDYEEGLVEEVLFKESSGSNTPIVLNPGASGGVSNSTLISTVWGLNASKFYTIDANGVYLAFGSATTYMELYPAGSGSKVSTGQAPPCNCFRYYFEPTTNGFKLRLESVVFPDTCP